MPDDRDEVKVANQPAPVIEPGYTFATITDKISSIVLTRPTSLGWVVGFGAGFLVTMMLLYALGYLFIKGVGIWGINIPIGWGVARVQRLWGVGNRQFGTVLSARLLFSCQPCR